MSVDGARVNRMERESRGVNLRSGNSHDDTVELDSEIDSDINTVGCCNTHVGEDIVPGCTQDLGLNPRLRSCCKYKNYKVSDTSTSPIPPTCECYLKDVSKANRTVEILNDTLTNVSTELINNHYSNISRTKPKQSPIFAISSSESLNPEVYDSNSRKSSSSARRDIYDSNSRKSSPSARRDISRKFFQRRTMLKCVCYSVIVLLVCMCGGVVMLNRTPGTSSSTHHRHRVHEHPKSGLHGGYKTGPEEESNIFMDVPYKSVPLKEFEKHLSNTRSVPDVMRLFLDRPGLSDDQVNSIVWMKAHSVLHGKRDYHAPGVMRDDEIAGDTGSGEQWFDHFQEVNKSKFSKCSEPKPELLRIRDHEHGSIMTYFPSCTIVHRCRSETGCCPYGEECKPRKENGIEIIDRHFMVLKRSFNEHGETVTPIQRLFAAKSFVNHTACECHRVEHETNCGKSCPRQFRKDRSGVNCDCVCRDANRKCRSIRRGIHPLDESDLECIKKEECIVPQCKTGAFNIATGFCPHFRRHKRQRNA